MNIVKCNIPTHDGGSISGLCLNQECEHQSAHCSRCQFEFHQGCTKQFKSLADIPFMLQEFEYLQQSIQQLKDKVESLFKKYIQQIEKESETIIIYKEISKLSNLNALGTMMKHMNSQFITITVQKLNQEIDQSFKDLQNKWKQEHHFLNQGDTLLNFQAMTYLISNAIKKPQIAMTNCLEQQGYFDILGKGDILQNLSNYEEAIVCYDKAIETNAGNENTWNNKGFALFSLKKYQEALDCYEMVLKLNPEKSETLNNKALILIEQELYDEAIICLNKAIKLNPEQKAYKLNLKVAKREEL